MLFAVDIGNTNIGVGVFRDARLVARFTLSTAISRTVDEHGLLLRGLLSQTGLEPSAITEMVISCVVPPLLPVIRSTAQRYFSSEPLLVEPGIKTGMPILYDNPQEVGADRIVNGVGAFEKYGGPAVVIDFGTATTFDAISQKGEYLGGVICPGVEISSRALFDRAARLPRVDIFEPDQVIGKNTVGSIRSGLFFGYLAMVEGVVRRVTRELGDECKVVATGGLSKLFADKCSDIHHHDPDLTLEGLRLLYERNR